ncbi:MAG: carbamoyltransferase HypF, partial [Bacteroidetes bacterium]|nr:carbamoyltransferase HypF [Bacteroidota bacterium]
ACDAFSETAVARLRELKNREGKPFAVMFRNLETARLYAEVNTTEETSLLSWRRPIVLLHVKNPVGSAHLVKSINSGLNLLGIMLPYLPFHYQLFRVMKTPAIVLTSGNFSSEPILIDNDEALKQFSSCTDLVVLHNRDIFNRTDDSVVRIIAGKERVFRRSRGYVPSPVRTGLETEGIVAFGAELTNCFCVGKGRKAFLSQHIGDLQGLETTLFYEQTLDRFIQLFRVKPALLAVDMHPDYISTRTAAGFGKLPVISIQHHHAHIASCMAEFKLDKKVIGVAFDGTGFGDDGNIWGSEFLVCDLVEYSRISHFGYLPLPGGDSASEEPWRMAVSWLYKVFGKEFTGIDLPVLRQTSTDNVNMLISMMERKINCPLTSGAGRFFDAVASLLGLCQVAEFPAQGPMLLESLVIPGCIEKYKWTAGQVINLDETLRGIINEIGLGVDPSIIATKFHNTITSIIFETVNGIRFRGGINKVVLSGGVFQNKYLLEGTEALLRKNNFEVFSHAAVPTNDGGIALGQLAVAAKRREIKCV